MELEQILLEDAECFNFHDGLCEDVDVGDIFIAEDELQEELLSQPSTSKQSSKSSRSTGRGRGRGSAASVAVEPVTPRLPCTFPGCKKTLKTAATLKAHMKRHGIKEASYRVPLAEELLGGIQDVFLETLSTLKSLPKIGDLGMQVVEYASAIRERYEQMDSESDICQFLFDTFGSLIHSIMSVFTTGLRTEFVKGANKILCSSSYVDELISFLEIFQLFYSQELSNCFVGVFTHHFVQNFLVYVFRKMRNAPDKEEELSVTKRQSLDDTKSTDFHQIIYHIGGSLVHSYDKKHSRYPNNVRLALFRAVLLENFVELEADPSTVCEDSVRAWTEEMDRGSLIFINKKAHEFFVLIAECILISETDEGTVEQDKVFETVLSKPTILFLWEQLVGSDLDEDDSLDLLQSVCEVFVNCARKGILKRRMNEALKNAYTSITLRHSVVS